MIEHGSSAKRFLDLVSSSRIVDNALAQAQLRNLKDWWIVGGIIRDSIWALQDGRDPANYIKDIDLIYYDTSECSPSRDREIELSLTPIHGINWSVKNQARMHLRNNDAPYASSQEAIWCAPETISAVSLKRTYNAQWLFSSSYGYDDLLTHIFRPTPHFLCKKFPEDYIDRVKTKRWIERWPTARIRPW